jgi:hypothetical protein
VPASSAATPSRGDWRGELPTDMVKAIERAIEQFRADETYELRHGKLAETIRCLEDLASHSRALREAIASLSPVALAAIHEEGMRRRITIGRYELADLAGAAMHLPEIAAAAAVLLESMHSPLPDEGQGAGSAIGRDSDLRAIRAELGSRGNFEFRSPKDKLGVAVLKAYMRHSPNFDVTRRGSAKFLEAFLERIWGEVEPDHKANWRRVIHARNDIASLVQRSLKAASAWRLATGKVNSSSAEH